MPAPVIGLIVSAVTSVGQFIQQRKAGRAQREASRTSQASQKIQNRAERRKAARLARIRRAQLAQSAENTGAFGSGFQAAADNITQTLSTNISLQQSQERAADGITRQNQIAASAQSKASALGAFNDIFQSGIDIKKSIDANRDQPGEFR